ncbi:FLYWCH-type domain-containing protein [Aphis craccivora]|uniref:FLYWCH-type domain-containing protein n=1 Tax=Aphis craccivora TaxID=307492 RepID=A0A6G0ZC28_APHCR|nr:FLYWCH-type domain-containing protein [Aphis craccivora]
MGLTEVFSIIRIMVSDFEPLHHLIWNVYQTTLDNGHRTNNETDGWNHRFSKLVGHNHPSIWTLIKKMRLELSSDETKLAQFAIGNLSKKKKLMKTYRKNCIKYIVMALTQRKIDEYLTAITIIMLP